MAIFGIKMLKEGCQMSRTEGQEELEEVQMELRQREEEVCYNLYFFLGYFNEVIYRQTLTISCQT